MSRWVSPCGCWNALLARLRPCRPEVTYHPVLQEDSQTYLARIEVRIRAERPDLPPPPTYSAQEIDAAFATVPPFDRYIFTLHRLDGMTYLQISSLLGISERRVERAIVRTLTCMRRALDKAERRRG